MALKRSRSPASDASRQCNCASLLEVYENFQLPCLREAQVKAGGYFERLHEKSWTCEIYCDTELQIGNPRQYQEQFKHPVVFSPFVLCIGFIGPHGEDETSCIETLIEYVRHSFSDLQDPKANSGVIVTCDPHSIHIRMACMPQYCQVCSKCADCRAQLPAIRILVESLGIMIQKIRARQIGPHDNAAIPYPRTELKVLKELLLRLLCGFQREGLHHRDVIALDHSLLYITRNGRKLIASTYESAPWMGFVYNVARQSLERWDPASGMCDLQCGICYESFDKVALLRLPCHCRICIECLSRCFESALRSRESFPPKCCGKILSIHQHAKYMQPEIIRKYIAVADEYKTSDSFYCANEACSAFIRPAFIEDVTAMCPKCLEQTCVKCRKLESKHLYRISRECPVEEEEKIFKTLVHNEQWKSCPRCLAIVERSDGCNHIK